MLWPSRLSVMGTRIHFRPKGPRAHMVENRIDVLKETLARILEQYPAESMGDPLRHTCGALNRLPGSISFSPCQAVFGIQRGDIFDPESQDSDFLQNTDVHGPFFHALRMRAGAHHAARKVLLDGRARRILRHQQGF